MGENQLLPMFTWFNRFLCSYVDNDGDDDDENELKNIVIFNNKVYLYEKTGNKIIERGPILIPMNKSLKGQFNFYKLKRVKQLYFCLKQINHKPLLHEKNGKTIQLLFRV